MYIQRPGSCPTYFLFPHRSIMKSCQFYFLNISKPFSSDVTTQPNPAFILSGTNAKHPGFPIGTLITSHLFSKPLPKDLLCQLFILLPTCATHTYISLCFKSFNGLQALRGKKTSARPWSLSLASHSSPLSTLKSHGFPHSLKAPSCPSP